MLHLTPEMLSASYDLLRTTPPFRRWKLPPSDEVEFYISNTKRWQADHSGGYAGLPHLIRISHEKAGQLWSLMWNMGHEMIHMHQRINKTETRTSHNPEFLRLAKQVCRWHGWDFKQFV